MRHQGDNVSTIPETGIVLLDKGQGEENEAVIAAEGASSIENASQVTLGDKITNNSHIISNLGLWAEDIADLSITYSICTRSQVSYSPDDGR